MRGGGGDDTAVQLLVALVSSRAHGISRSAAPAAARSPSVASSRCGASYSTTARASAAASATSCFRALPVRGRKPRKTYSDARNPLTLSPATAAHAPGTGTSGTPRSAHAAASSAPGSEMPGVPASLTTATLRPASACSSSFGIAVRRLCSWCDSSADGCAPRWRSSGSVTRVSSDATTSACRSVRIARSVRSSRLPIGVATT